MRWVFGVIIVDFIALCAFVLFLNQRAWSAPLLFALGVASLSIVTCSMPRTGVDAER